MPGKKPMSKGEHKMPNGKMMKGPMMKGPMPKPAPSSKGKGGKK